MLPSSKLKAVGPTGWSADQGVGRPASGANRPQLLGVGLVWAWPEHRGRACLELFCFGSWATLGPFEHESYSGIFYDFLLGQSVLATCLLAQKHIFHILEGKVLFRDFIEYKYV